MGILETYLVYTQGLNGRKRCLRVLKNDHNFYFVLRDLVEICSLNWPRFLHKRMASWEKRRMPVDGTSMAVITIEGFCNLLPRDKNLILERHLLIELIAVFSESEMMAERVQNTRLINWITIYDHRGVKRTIQKKKCRLIIDV